MNGEQRQAVCHRNTDSGYRNRSRLRSSAIALAISIGLAGIGGVTMPQSAMAQATSATSQQQFSIPAGNLREALDALASQSGMTVLYSPDLVAGKTTRGLSGRYTSNEALRHLLQGSGLEAQDAGDSTFTLKRATAPAANPQAGRRNTPTTAQSTEPETHDLEKITVTGSRIRGGGTPSPVITIGSERIREEGFTDLGEVIRSVPQNFRGGQNPGVTTASVNIANINFTGGSGLNLRGLGPDATLTLLNGRRMSYGGLSQAIDISAIPVEAVDRIEIVADGASAIYGSDAVGGVGNVILKRDFDGVRVGARYGTATDGGLTTREYTITAGTVWSSGGMIATYKYASTDPIYLEQRDYIKGMDIPRTLYPGSDLRSGLLSAYQALGEAAELRLDALRTERELLRYETYSPPDYYQSLPDTTTSLVSPSIEFSLPRDWTLSVGGTWGKEESVEDFLMGNTETGVSTLLYRSCLCAESRVYEVGGEGPLFVLGGGDARLAVGTGYRTNEFVSKDLLSSTHFGGDESSRFAYAEVNLPLIGTDSNIAGAQRLELTGAVRREDYDSFGGVTTPKLGLVYGPSADFTLKASWGKSFKAPTLNQQHSPQAGYLWRASDVGGTGYADDATAMMTWGGNPDLDPERARTWTASLAFHPKALPGLELELTWFDIDYTDRVVEAVASYWLALGNPIYDEFIEYSPTAEQQAEVLAKPTFYNYAGADYDASNVVAIIFDDYTNVARQRVKGIDLSGSYGFEFGDGRLTVRGSASWLDSSQQNSAGQSPFDLAGTIFNPAKFNSRLGAVWTQGGFIASAFANYASGVTNTAVAGIAEKTASFTTFDATLHYNIGARGGAWSELEFALSAQNLFDRAPPLHTPVSNTWLPYDSTNYSAIGRFLSVSVSKRW